MDFEALPATLTRLTFGYNFNLPLGDTLLRFPLTHLTFGTKFNQPVDDLLPHSLLHLTFGKYFYHTINNLPPSLTHLILGDVFDFPINSLPSGLVELKFGRNFDQAIGCLPPSLIRLSFGFCFGKQLPNPLPPLLTHLTFDWNYAHHIFELPKGITHLNITSIRQVPNLPESLHTLILQWAITKIEYPPNLKCLKLHGSGNVVDHLPPSLETLHIYSSRNDQLLSIPPNLTKLVMSSHCLFPYPLPSSLRCLDINLTKADQADHDLTQIFSLPNLTQLKIIFENIKLTKQYTLPPKLTKISLFCFVLEMNFAEAFDFLSAPLLSVTITGHSPIPNLPSTVRKLTLEDYSAPNTLPQHLEQLSIAFEDPGRMAPLPPFPPSLQTLILDIYYNEGDSTPLLPPVPQSLKVLEARKIFIPVGFQFPPRLSRLVVSPGVDLPPLPPALEILEFCKSRFGGL